MAARRYRIARPCQSVPYPRRDRQATIHRRTRSPEFRRRSGDAVRTPRRCRQAAAPKAQISRTRRAERMQPFDQPLYPRSTGFSGSTRLVRPRLARISAIPDRISRLSRVLAAQLARALSRCAMRVAEKRSAPALSVRAQKAQFIHPVVNSVGPRLCPSTVTRRQVAGNPAKPVCWGPAPTSLTIQAETADARNASTYEAEREPISTGMARDFDIADVIAPTTPTPGLM